MGVQVSIKQAVAFGREVSTVSKIKVKNGIGSYPTLDSMAQKGLKAVAIEEFYHLDVHNDFLENPDYTCLIFTGVTPDGENVEISTSSEAFINDVLSIAEDIGEVNAESEKQVSAIMISIVSCKSKNNSGFFYRAKMEDVLFD